MKTAIVSLTRNGKEISLKIAKKLRDDNKCIRYAFEKYTDYDAVTFTNLKETVKEIFVEFDAVIFVCACGIAVRAIAPYIVSKFSDPAVVVVDEQGKYAVSLISGHIGGANAIAEKIAHIINAIPVITTATDIGGKFSPDSFAVSNNLHIYEPELAKKIAALIVDSKKVGLYCDYDYVNLPKEYFSDTSKIGICISRNFAKSPFTETLHLVPKNIIIGVGCRKNTSPQMLENFILKNLAANSIEIFQLCKICSINIKRNEKAINEFSSKYCIPTVFFSSEELMKAKGVFSASQFVIKTTGADNVCERSAVCGGGKIIVRKIAENGMTFAAAEKDLIIDFGRRIL